LRHVELGSELLSKIGATRVGDDADDLPALRLARDEAFPKRRLAWPERLRQRFVDDGVAGP
jgi:hypothetical protein